LVLQKLVPSGSKIKKGDVLAEFDREAMLTRVEDFRAAVAQTEASFLKFKAELDVARKAHQQTVDAAKADLEKARLDLKAAPVLSAIEAERARLAVEEAEARYKQLQAETRFFDIGLQAQVRNAEIEVQQSRIDLRRAENNANRMVVRSPIDGLAVVQTTFRGSEFQQIREGDQLWPGMMFVQVVDPSSMIINALVNQVDVEQVRLGQKARVRFDAFPDLQVMASVQSIGAITRPGGPRATFVKEVPVVLKLEGTDPRIIPDLSVSCDLVVETEQEAAIVPLSSVFSDDGGRTFFAFARSGSDWERRVVELGLTNNVSAAVRSGLRPGEVVATQRPQAKQATKTASAQPLALRNRNS
jgi:multidrug efflux pump subunit AcrA (membrane-fusion protein)